MTDQKHSLPSAAPDVSALTEALGNDLDLIEFYLSWIKNNMNATEAYHELHPEIDRASAQVQGSRLLAKIDRVAVMKCYGLDHETYYLQLHDGLRAMKRDQFSGEMYEDHTARKPYHDKLGKLLGIETDKPGIAIQNNGEMTLEFT